MAAVNGRQLGHPVTYDSYYNYDSYSYYDPYYNDDYRYSSSRSSYASSYAGSGYYYYGSYSYSSGLDYYSYGSYDYSSASADIYTTIAYDSNDDYIDLDASSSLESTETPIENADPIYSKILWWATVNVIVSAVSFCCSAHKGNPPTEVVCICCIPWGLTALMGMAVAAPFVCLWYLFFKDKYDRVP